VTRAAMITPEATSVSSDVNATNKSSDTAPVEIVASASTDSSRRLGHVLRGFGALAASNIVSQVIGFAALAYVARKIGPTNLGAYGFAMAIVGYFGLLSGFGMNNLATRDVAKNRDALNSTVSETLFLQGALSVGLYGLLVVLSPVLVSNHEARRMVPIVGLTLITGAFTLDWVLLSLGRFKAVAIWRLAGQVIYAILIPLLIVSGSTGAIRYAWLNVLGIAVTAVGIAVVAGRAMGTWPPRARRQALLVRLRRSVPFGYSLIMIQIYALVDALMLGYLDSTHAVGIYAAANKLPMALVILANVWINAFLPHTARSLASEPKALAYDLGRVVTVALTVSAAMCVGAVLCADKLIPLMFGSSFGAASGPFSLLVVAGALVLVQSNFSNVLRGQRYYTVTISIAAGAIVLLNFILIPLSGPMGSAIATVVGEVGLTVATFLGVRQRLGHIPIDFARVVRGCGAVAAMAAAMTVIPTLGGGVVVQICAGAAVFAVASLSLRVFDVALLRTG
jgi:PST family polysaccharide transporter